VIHESPGLRLGGSHEVIAVERSFDFIVRTPAVPGVDLVQAALRPEHVLRVALDIGGRTLKAA
jgi:hypothetical protein